MKAISLRRCSAVAAATACLVIGTATSASAGTNSPVSDASNGDGYAYFVADGDKFLIHDNQCDNGTVWAQLTWYKSGQGWHFRTIHNTSGCNTTDERHPWNIPEGADVWVRACGSMSDGYSNTGDGVLSAGHDCDFTQGGQHGVA
ncbi:hypothetical protein GCM10010269_45780 [Streptomyces humidus]|uniref:Secreted protein n=1 Tax=Streptomyces humidus TaxID=52259 RepID=A0A918FZA8_9ACTN|nr:hypothetical protein GCM10010269_45780 [Streptomyces humidus]